MTATMPDTQLTGQMLIAGEQVRGSGKQIRAFDPVAGQDLEPTYYYGDASDVDAACAAAATAFADYRATTSEQRAQFLEGIAANIEAVKDAIVERAVAESGLPQARIAGEVGRTTGQLRLFGGVLREGSWNGARIDAALPDRTPVPRPDIRQRSVPLGPVAPRRRSPPDALSSSRATTPTPAPPSWSAAPSPMPSPLRVCPPVPSPCSSDTDPSSAPPW